MDDKRQTMGTAFDCRVTSPEAQKNPHWVSRRKME